MDSLRWLCLATIFMLLAAIITQSGCGFRLRGAAGLPPELEPLYVQSLSRYDDIEQTLAVALNQRNIQTGEEHNASSRVRILGENSSLRDVLVASTNTQQLTMVWEFIFEQRNAQGEWEGRIKRGSVSESQIFTLTDNANTANPEYRRILLELRTSLADKLIRALTRQ